MTNFWMMNNQDGRGKINIFGDIADYGWWDEVTANKFLQELNALDDVNEIDVYINSNGGSALAGNAIYNMLLGHKAKINTYAVGIAASSASLIFMAGDNRFMYGSSFLMIHGPQAEVYGNSDNLRKVADDLDVLTEGVLTAYARCGTMTKEELKEMVKEDTWFTAEKAKEQGFATEIIEGDITMSLSNNILKAGNIEFNMSANKSFSEFITNKGINLKKKEEENMAVIQTIEDIKKNYPEMFKKIQDEGVIMERTRMKALDEISMEGAEDIILRAKYEEPQTVAEVSLSICKAMKDGTISMKNSKKLEEEKLDKFNLKKHDAEDIAKMKISQSLTDEEKIKLQADKIAMKLNSKRGL